MLCQGTGHCMHYPPTCVCSWLAIILYLGFLFLVIVVLLNLLIAQMTDTYASVQEDVQRSIFFRRAWTIANIERNSLLVSAIGTLLTCTDNRRCIMSP